MADLGKGPRKPGPPLILGKKKKTIAEGRKAGRASNSPFPYLRQGLDVPLGSSMLCNNSLN